MFLRFCLITVTSIFTLTSCGTDVKPTYFLNMLKHEQDIDNLTNCLEGSSEEGDIITINLDKQCMIELSNRDNTNPNISADFADVVKNPEAYMDKIITFDAVVRKLHHNRGEPELYTGDPNLKFLIYAHGAPIFILNKEGEEIPLQINKKYTFTCRIYRIEWHADWGDRRQVTSEFIISENKKVLIPPQIVVLSN